jgi:hypothetical protein
MVAAPPPEAPGPWLALTACAQPIAQKNNAFRIRDCMEYLVMTCRVRRCGPCRLRVRGADPTSRVRPLAHQAERGRNKE